MEQWKQNSEFRVERRFVHSPGCTRLKDVSERQGQFVFPVRTLGTLSCPHLPWPRPLRCFPAAQAHDGIICACVELAERLGIWPICVGLPAFFCKLCVPVCRFSGGWLRPVSEEMRLEKLPRLFQPASTAWLRQPSHHQTPREVSGRFHVRSQSLSLS